MEVHIKNLVYTRSLINVFLSLRNNFKLYITFYRTAILQLENVLINIATIKDKTDK